MHYNYCITWHCGHGPTWTRKACSEQGGELAVQFSHTFLENQFSSPKWQTVKRRRKRGKLFPFTSSRSILKTTWPQQLCSGNARYSLLHFHTKMYFALTDVTINFVQNTHTLPPKPFTSTQVFEPPKQCKEKICANRKHFRVYHKSISPPSEQGNGTCRSSEVRGEAPAFCAEGLYL